MSVTYLKMADMNDNNLVTLDLENVSLSEVPDKNNMAVIGEKQTEELFPELEDLAKEPSKFLLQNDNTDLELDFSKFEADVDTDLMNYFVNTVEDQNIDQEIAELQENLPVAFQPTTQTTPSAQREVELHLVEDEDPTPNWRPQIVREQKTSSGSVKVVRVVKVEQSDSRATSPESSSNGSGRNHMSKSAVAARENRQKKKQYISGLEDSVSFLNQENTTLKKDVSKMRKTINDLRKEVQYLSSVLENQSTLSALLKNVCTTPGVKFSGVGFSNRHIDDDDEVDEVDVVNTKIEPASRVKPKLTSLTSRKRSLDSDDDDTEDEGHWKENRLRTKNPHNTRRNGSQKVQKIDHDYASETKNCRVVLSRNSIPTSVTKGLNKRNISQKSGSSGVCLHVANNSVSLEFCAKCSNKASARKS